MSAITGVRAAISSKSSIVNGILNSRAIARRWSTPLVEPPVATAEAAAFSSASRVTMCEGRTSRSTRSTMSRPHSCAASAFFGDSAGIPFSPGGLIPRNSMIVAIVLAVNCPPHAPAPGQAALSSSFRSSAEIFPAAYAPIPSYTSATVTSLPRKSPGAIEPV